ncbi:hypothetical protein BVG16_05435 [Paenibacillus selenitireducens]|uniref:DUF7852 domain-containing protein n=1 Tax=Paenibacillus selenitireducens TaxID=1324314 RepID=A0A1T2XK37_9BACL|nr:hypothetical protein BVG16_05435 [Paenibacillus selenitireducens]
MYIQAPKILARIQVPVNISTEITLDRPASELKRKSDRVLLQECQLVAIHAHHFKIKEGKLFIEGVIETNMEFAAVENTSCTESYGDICHTTAQVPFKSCTHITFAEGNEPNLAQQQEQSTFLFTKPKHHGTMPSLRQFSNQSVYQHEPYCELVSYSMDEVVEEKGTGMKHEGSCHEKTFNILSKQIVLHLMIEVLQVQQIPLQQH